MVFKFMFGTNFFNQKFRIDLNQKAFETPKNIRIAESFFQPNRTSNSKSHHRHYTRLQAHKILNHSISLTLKSSSLMNLKKQRTTFKNSTFQKVILREIHKWEINSTSLLHENFRSCKKSERLWFCVQHNLAISF